MALFSEARNMAQELSEQLIVAFPPALETMTGRKSQDMGQKALGQLLAATVTQQRERKLGLLGRIVFARHFQYRLNKAGYSAPFIRSVMTEILSKISFARA